MLITELFRCFEKERINTNFILPLGGACRPALALKMANLRYFSSPFDWMYNYNLSAVQELFENNFSLFYINFNIIGSCNGKLKIIDNKNGMISMHHINDGNDFDLEFNYFLKNMHRRYARLINYFNNADHFVILSNRDKQLSEIIIFIEFLIKYTKKNFTYINIENRDTEDIKQIIIDKSHFLYNIEFLDIHPDGINSPYAWRGNMKIWLELLKAFSVRKLT